MTTQKQRLTRTQTAMRKHALAYPGVHEDFPWGHAAYKVKGKIFLAMYLDPDEGCLSLSMKLPVSGAAALALPFASPTGYGLGKSGWVTARLGTLDEAPLDMLREWVDESFRAIAPKRVLAELEEAESDGPPKSSGTAPARKPKRKPKQPVKKRT